MALDYPLQKPDSVKMSLQTGHGGQLGRSVLEGVAGLTRLLLLGSREFPVHLLQRVVDIGPIQVPAPLCPRTEEQGHVHHYADQQKENQGQGEGQTGGPEDRREILSGACGADSGLWECWRDVPPSYFALPPATGALGWACRGHTGTVKEQMGLWG